MRKSTAALSPKATVLRCETTVRMQRMEPNAQSTIRAKVQNRARLPSRRSKRPPISVINRNIQVGRGRMSTWWPGRTARQLTIELSRATISMHVCCAPK